MARRPRTSASGPLKLDLALQGGGSHGAFTWGVLDRLLDEERIEFDGISGTSAGAVNAVAVAAGLTDGGRRGAQQSLRRVWEGVGRLGSWVSEPAQAAVAGTPLEPWARAAQEWQRAILDAAGPLGQWQSQATRMWAAAWTQAFSPYDSNPWGLHPLRRILEQNIDFDAVRRCSKARLFIATTSVRNGRLRLFSCPDLSVDVVLASACLPTLFQGVQIDGETYWDGGYAGNPALLPLVAHTDADDVLVVQINPIERAQDPRTAQDILDRMNEITFNATLLKDLRALALLQRLGELDTDTAAALTGSTMRPLGSLATSPADLLDRVQNLRLHRIDGGDELAALGAGTKTDSTLPLLERLHDLGWAQADAWLAANGADLGRRSTLDLTGYLDMDL
ncbi:NTE family protein [Kineosphaera limosa]|uniref:PNPLA domain-containing protein n=1 Tax=Kineosphaera limosa NBRC 100340 TaxID=1184609 RepID=K6VN41_9MICO|nr:patatin-like phospholipase family protein [Kineosphaera limosa]NYE00241.1 NTE family protein [Kineosphaera limosa]GAB97648.1 hypothetical protein KILIM_077_00050 [Kineosphaera limosa NBRC 100340]